MKTKILTKFQVHILNCSHFTAISIIFDFYSVLTAKPSFFEQKMVRVSKVKMIQPLNLAKMHQIYGYEK